MLKKNLLCQRRIGWLVFVCTLTTSATLVATPPAITRDPASQTVFYGDPALFSVEASGTTPLSYQWLREGVPIASAISTNYTLSNVSSNDHGAVYSARVSNNSGSVTSRVAVLTVDFGQPGPETVTSLLSYRSQWKYNETENLDGQAWTAPDFDDSAWLSGPGLLAYEDNGQITPLIGTFLASPRTPPAGLLSGHANYFRTAVVIPPGVAQLKSAMRCDDGAVICVDGKEVQRVRILDGQDVSNMTLATGFPPDLLGGSDATIDEGVSIESWGLKPGTNHLAVSVHQANTSSSDVVWGLVIDAVTTSRLRDTNAPTVVRTIPASGSQVSSFRTLEVHFDEGVKGLQASDLLINGASATNLVAFAPNIYVFEFPQPPNGDARVTWNPDHGITDLSANSNRFSGGSCLFSVGPQALPKYVRLTEFMASNARTVRDNNGRYSDWIEIYNGGETTVSLAGWSLTDDPAQLRKWVFPDRASLLPKSYLLIWASGQDRRDPAAPLHTNFKLSKAQGSFLGLVFSDGTTVISAFQNCPPQFDDVSYGRDRVDPSLAGYFSSPTPGSINAVMGAGFGPAVKFSISSGTFVQPFSLVLKVDDPNWIIRYHLVTDGTTASMTGMPDSTSPIYTQPLTISTSTQVRARAFPKSGNSFPGPLHNETYLQLAQDVAGFSSDLPVVIFHSMGGGDVAATEEQFMVMQAFDTRTGRSSVVNPPDVAAQGYFHRRGQATFWNPKASLRVETQDPYGEDLDVDLLGFPPESDWVFYGINCFDKVLMHNPLAHGLYRQMGHYSSNTRYVEVYVKDDWGSAGPVTAADYNGLYVLEEKIKIGKNRVDIDKLRPENTNAPSVTGGYLLSIDKSNPGGAAYLAGLTMWYLDPDYFEITAPDRTAQKAYIDGYFQSFYSALTGPNWTNPDTGYRAYIDLESWVDYHLHNTFVFNADMLRISSYFYKPRGGKIVQGPLWDFDRAFADSNDDRGFNPRRWRSGSSDQGTDPFNSGGTFNNPWYSKMCRDPDFWQAWIDRYQELRRTVYHTTNLNAWIDGIGNQLREATVREYKRWRGSGGSDTSPRSGSYTGDGYTYRFPGTWQGEVDFCKRWFADRVSFMDGNFLNPPVFSLPGGQASAGSVLKIYAPTVLTNSTIFYTLDGTDPRLPGGAVSPGALWSTNTAVIQINSNTRVFARNWNADHKNLTGANNPPINSSWSGPMVATFVVATPPLVVTEIMFNPAPAGAGTNNNEAFEFIELKNRGTEALSLPGFRFSNGIEFAFGSTNDVREVPPGGYVLVVRNLAAFRTRYPGVTNVAGEFSGHLDNSGETLELKGPLGEPILDFRYDSKWAAAADGSGFSLVIRDEQAPFHSWTNGGSWRASSNWGGSPGRTDPLPAAFSPIVINEALTHTDLPEVDTVELYNPGANPVSVGGWFLSDNATEPAKYRIPDDALVPANGYLLLNETHFNAGGPSSFALSSLGDGIYLSSGNGTNLTGFRSGFEFGAQHNGVTFGRWVTSDGKEHFVAEEKPSLGAMNSGPRVGPIVINEIMYAPKPFSPGDPDTVTEFVELRNISGNPVDLFDPAHPTNTWKLDGAAQFRFPPNTTLPAWSYLILVSFDPSQDPASLAWFRRTYVSGTNGVVVGPFEGHLANEGERLALYQPDAPQMPGSANPGFVPYVLVEEVRYSQEWPWPANAFESGLSLQRLASAAFANDPANWQAAAPTPGLVNAGAFEQDSDGDGMPDEAEWVAGTNPRDPGDALVLESVSTSGGLVRMQFNAVPGRSYVLEATAAPAAAWTPVLTGIRGTNACTLTDQVSGECRYYRLRVEIPR